MAAKGIEQLTSDFVNKLSAYKEPVIRENVFSEKIKEIPGEVLIDIIMYAIGMAYKKKEKYLELMSMFTNKTLLKSSLGEKGMYVLARLAAEKGYKEFSIFLMNHTTVPGHREIDEPLPEPRIGGMPLGLRKSLSKSNNRDTIEKLIYDPDPSVISILLDNPRMTEADVLKIASKRPNSGRLLKIIYKHERWKNRYSIQCSLAMNPYTPADIALRILPGLFSFDLIKILNDRKLSGIVRGQASVVLEQGIAL